MLLTNNIPSGGIMRTLRLKLANRLEMLVHYLRHGSFYHRATVYYDLTPGARQVVKEISEDFYGDVYEVHDCRLCSQVYFGQWLGNVLIEEIDGERVYTGVFKADRLNPWIDQGYSIRQLPSRDPKDLSRVAL